MKKSSILCNLLLIAFLFVSQGCYEKKIPPKKSKLYGTWKSDSKRSMAFNKKNVILTPTATHALTNLFGHMSITYQPNLKASYTMESLSIKVGTNTVSTHGSTHSFSYQILGETSNSVAIIECCNPTNKNSITLIHFVNPNLYWIYCANDKPEINVREYFRRIK